MKNIREYIENNKADLVLVRGLPGSGKSTYVKKNLKGYKHFEADQFFEKNGEYKFDVNKLKYAHELCFSNTKKELEKGNKVVVSNTFVRRWELDKYLQLARELDKTVKVIRMTSQFKNEHGVPDDKVKIMRKNFEDYEGEIKVK